MEHSLVVILFLTFARTVSKRVVLKLTQSLFNTALVDVSNICDLALLYYTYTLALSISKETSFISNTLKKAHLYETWFQQGISELEFYGDLVYRIRTIVGKSKFAE